MKKFYTLYVRCTSIDSFDVEAETLEEAVRKHYAGDSVLQKEEVDGADPPHAAEWSEWQEMGGGGLSHGWDDAEGTCTPEELAKALEANDAV